ncbi:lipoprotein signal peptidase [Neisseria dumasiana]|uniref:Lipoprotein signal peptidase n=1 Tax=Neisseria dumasiana TaxID=1931275 RepID=A0A1X3DIK0_9NEIS|nr:lipoprotein signal peptidase [Neisseria dumasiana]
MQTPHLRRISALRAARSFAYLYDMSALAVLLRLELHPHLAVLQRSHLFGTVRLKRVKKAAGWEGRI